MADYEAKEYWAECSKQLAYMLYRVMEGDVEDDIYETLKEFGFINSDYEWIYDEE